MSDRKRDHEHLQWIHDRLVKVHGEDENVDYLYKLRAIIDRLEPINERTDEEQEAINKRDRQEYMERQDYLAHKELLKDWRRWAMNICGWDGIGDPDNNSLRKLVDDKINGLERQIRGADALIEKKDKRHQGEHASLMLIEAEVKNVAARLKIIEGQSTMDTLGRIDTHAKKAINEVADWRKWMATQFTIHNIESWTDDYAREYIEKKFAAASKETKALRSEIERLKAETPHSDSIEGHWYVEPPREDTERTGIKRVTLTADRPVKAVTLGYFMRKIGEMFEEPEPQEKLVLRDPISGKVETPEEFIKNGIEDIKASIKPMPKLKWDDHHEGVWRALANDHPLHDAQQTSIEEMMEQRWLIAGADAVEGEKKVKNFVLTQAGIEARTKRFGGWIDVGPHGAKLLWASYHEATWDNFKQGNTYPVGVMDEMLNAGWVEPNIWLNGGEIEDVRLTDEGVLARQQYTGK